MTRAKIHPDVKVRVGEAAPPTLGVEERGDLVAAPGDAASSAAASYFSWPRIEPFGYLTVCTST
jgi:hypothetical protein